MHTIFYQKCKQFQCSSPCFEFMQTADTCCQQYTATNNHSIHYQSKEIVWIYLTFVNCATSRVAMSTELWYWDYFSTHVCFMWISSYLFLGTWKVQCHQYQMWGRQVALPSSLGQIPSAESLIYASTRELLLHGIPWEGAVCVCVWERENKYQYVSEKVVWTGHIKHNTLLF